MNRGRYFTAALVMLLASPPGSSPINDQCTQKKEEPKVYLRRGQFAGWFRIWVKVSTQQEVLGKERDWYFVSEDRIFSILM